MISVSIGYNNYIMPKEAALTLLGILEKAEVFEEKYITQEERSSMGLPDNQSHTYHVYPNENMFNMKLVSDDLYRMAKLAGKPDRK